MCSRSAGSKSWTSNSLVSLATYSTPCRDRTKATAWSPLGTIRASSRALSSSTPRLVSVPRIAGGCQKTNVRCGIAAVFSVNAVAGRPVSISRLSVGFPEVAEAARIVGEAPYLFAIRSSRRMIMATCAPKTPLYMCASSTITKSRCRK